VPDDPPRLPKRPTAPYGFGTRPTDPAPAPDGPRRSESRELAAQGYDVAAVDRAQAEVYALAVAVLAEQVRGGAELPDGFSERVAHAIQQRARRPLLVLASQSWFDGRSYAAPLADHDAVTPVKPTR
jgi:hypothetical protein